MNAKLSFVLAFAAACVTTATVAQELKGDAQAGSTKIAMCIGCHGIKGYQASFPEVYRVPMISGQNAKYIASSLTAYQKGDRKHPTMRECKTLFSWVLIWPSLFCDCVFLQEDDLGISCHCLVLFLVTLPLCSVI